MIIKLEKECGVPVSLNTDTLEFILGKELNENRYQTRLLHDLDAVWANPVLASNRVIYRYTSGLWLAEDKATWGKSNIIYGIVAFNPGIFSGEFNKSSGQYHPIIPPNTMATPEIYTVLYGTGHFMLQKSSPPYESIEDAILVVAQIGETFAVPPDYGHLQINPGTEPLVFSYAVMDGMKGVYEPFKIKKGAIYYEMAYKDESNRFVFNANYPKKVPLRVIKARDICQLSFLNDNVTYQKIRDNLDRLEFLTNSEKYPENAKL